MYIKEYEKYKDASLIEGFRGSYAYNLNIRTSDVDYFSIVKMPISYYFGLDRFDTLTIMQDNVDLVVYDILYFIKQLYKGVTNVVELLFLNDDKYFKSSKIWNMLKDNRHLFLNRSFCSKTIGYIDSMLRKGKNNKKLMHAIRLIWLLDSFDGERIYTTLLNGQRDRLLDIKENGFSNLNDVWSKELDRIKAKYEDIKPDYDKINQLCENIFNVLFKQ